jgi:hypothetical protein
LLRLGGDLLRLGVGGLHANGQIRKRLLVVLQLRALFVGRV